MAKKLLCMILAMFMVLGLATACNDESPAPPAGGGNNANDGDDKSDDQKNDDDPAKTDDDPAKTDDDPPPPAPPVSYSDRDWPDLSAYFPFEYDQSRVIYATGFEADEEGFSFCVCEEKGQCDKGEACESAWGVRGSTEVLELSDIALQGGTSLRVSERTSGWNGPIVDITDYVLDTEMFYEAFAWIRMDEDASPGRIIMSSQTNGIEGEKYIWWEDYDAPENVLSKRALPVGLHVVGEDGEEQNPGQDGQYNIPRELVNGDWTLLRGSNFFYKPDADKIYLYFETLGGRSNEMNFYIDCLVLLVAE